MRYRRISRVMISPILYSPALFCKFWVIQMRHVVMAFYFKNIVSQSWSAIRKDFKKKGDLVIKIL